MNYVKFHCANCGTTLKLKETKAIYKGADVIHNYYAEPCPKCTSNKELEKVGTVVSNLLENMSNEIALAYRKIFNERTVE